MILPTCGDETPHDAHPYQTKEHMPLLDCPGVRAVTPETTYAYLLDSGAAQRRITSRRRFEGISPCPCECNSGGFCGGCGHAGCGRR